MSAEIHAIPGPGPGVLFIGPAPSGGRGLASELRAMREEGVDLLVSMLPAEEALRLGLQDEAAACAAAGIAFRSFPIRDFGLPGPALFAALVDELAAEIAAGRGVAVHCRAGIGRSGMAAACVAARFLGSAEAAVAAVSRARGLEIPDTPAQRVFIDEVVALDRG
ncbi:protein-tyrosine phosphatase family protein [Albimonas pacifica]|uniref:Cyclin-dependent kinase inhibitor 3 (CDKN3) n=1 Tax=Albimonas pacifica TaxID=1114924 RepID=A0A1I3C1Q1_9RHOB|nr:hypothetical protein [Albimonas pacifica]SFH68487.1 Cyclin-dependent kinase inhibitor 3 (CDKN3) [Albimonas pacifica]